MERKPTEDSALNQSVFLEAAEPPLFTYVERIKNAQELISFAQEAAQMFPGDPVSAEDSLVAAATARRMVYTSYDEGLTADLPEYAHSRHILAYAADFLGEKYEQEVKWLQLSRVDISGENEEYEGSVEFLSTPHESVIVPVTTDGRIVLVQRYSPALGESITTVLSRAIINDQESDITALQALHKLAIPDSRDTVAEETGNIINPWKYIDSETHCFVTDLPMTAAELSERSSIRDSKTEKIVLLTEEELFRAIDDGSITDLRTILAVQLALAKRRGWLETPDDTFTGDPYILSSLQRSLPILWRGSVEGGVDSEWFPSEIVRGDKIVRAKSHQSQALGVIQDESGKPNFVFLIEPFYARSSQVLCLASGSIEEGHEGAQTAKKELREETGYIAADTEATMLVPPSYVMPLYILPRSEVWEVSVVHKGDKTGGDEQTFEQGEGVIIPADQVMWYIANGYITDASAMAAVFAWKRKHEL